MKKAGFLLLTALLLGCSGEKGADAVTTGEWRLLGPKHTNQPLHAVWAAPTGEVVAVGGQGTILVSHDQGKSWEKAAHSSERALLAVTGLGDVIIAVGEGGSLLRSKDKGKTWEAKTSASLTDLHRVFAIGNDLFAVGVAGTILHSPDMGDTWEEQKSGTRQTLHEIFGSALDNLRVHGEDGVVLVSKDRGATWRSPEGGLSIKNGSRLSCVTQGSDGVWYALEKGAVYASEDGGSSWSLFYQGPELTCVAGQKGRFVGFGPRSLHYQEGNDPWQDADMRALGQIPTLLSLAKVSDDVWVATGEAGLIIRSEDGGKTWQNLTGAVEVALSDLWESPSGALYAVGAGGTLLRSPAKDAPFVVSRVRSPFPPNATLFDILVEGDAIHIVGDQGGFTSNDRGVSFTPWEGCQESILRAVVSVEGTLYAVGKKVSNLDTPSTTGVICRSRNGGKTWDQNTLPDQDLYDIWGSSASSLFVLSPSQILRSRDGGATFAVATEANLSLRTLSGSGTLLIAAGEAGTLLRSRDGGENWEKKTAPQGIKDVFVSSETEIFLAGQNLLSRSQDGGETFTPSEGIHGPLARVFARGASVRAVGEDGLLWSSEDGGASFRLTRSAVGRVALHGLGGDPSGKLYAVGAHGTMLVSEDGGASWWVRATDADSNLIAISGASEKDIYALDEEGGIYHSRDGENFFLMRFYTRAKLHDIYAGEAGVFLVGEKGTILQASEQGLVLTPRKPGADTSASLFTVWGAAPSYVFAAGEKGALAISEDGGKTFSFREEKEALTDFVDLVGASADEFYAVGGNVIYRFSEKGKTARSHQARPPFFDLYRVALEGSSVVALDRTGAFLRYDPNTERSDEEKKRPQDELSVVRLGAGGKIYALGKKGAIWVREK